MRQSLLRGMIFVILGLGAAVPAGVLVHPYIRQAAAGLDGKWSEIIPYMAWTSLPFAVLGFPVLLSRLPESTLVLCLIVSVLMTAGAWLYIDAMYLSYPDAQGAAVFFSVPVCQLAAAIATVVIVLVLRAASVKHDTTR